MRVESHAYILGICTSIVSSKLKLVLEEKRSPELKLQSLKSLLLIFFIHWKSKPFIDIKLHVWYLNQCRQFALLHHNVLICLLSFTDSNITSWCSYVAAVLHSLKQCIIVSLYVHILAKQHLRACINQKVENNLKVQLTSIGKTLLTWRSQLRSLSCTNTQTSKNCLTLTMKHQTVLSRNPIRQV